MFERKTKKFTEVKQMKNLRFYQLELKITAQEFKPLLMLLRVY
jgi:hypothetical protein